MSNKETKILSVRDVDLNFLIAERREAGGYTPSPKAWEDKTLFFPLLDRFSDGKEAGVSGEDGETISQWERPCFVAQKFAGNAVKPEKAARA